MRPNYKGTSGLTMELFTFLLVHSTCHYCSTLVGL